MGNKEMTLAAARSAVRMFEAARANDAVQPCEYGHLSCSDQDGGPCFDEAMHVIENYNDWASESRLRLMEAGRDELY